MTKTNKVRIPLFYRYLLSYIVIFLIPFIITSTVFYYKSADNLRHEIIQSNINKLEQVRTMTDLRMKELREIAMRISYDPRLTPYMVQQPYSGKQAIDELKRYKANSSIINELILYYRGGEDVYSPRGISTLDALMRGFQPVNQTEYAQFKEEMNAVSKPVVRPLDFVSADPNATNRLIVFIYPIPANNLSAHGSVVYFVKEEMLVDLIRDMLGDINGNVYIFNDERAVLAANHGVSLSSAAVNQLSISQPGVVDKRFDDQDYSIVTVQSEVTGWSFVAAIPQDQFYAKVASFRSFSLAALAFIALIGLGTAIYVTIKQYKPIHMLSRYLGNKNKQFGVVLKHSDELATIHETLELVFQDSEQLRKQVDIQQPFVRDQCLMKLLKGDMERLPETMALLKELRISLDGPYFFVMMCTLDKESFEGEGVQEREHALNLLTEFAFGPTSSFGLEFIYENAVIMIANMRIEDRNTLEKHQRQFVQKLMEHFNMHSRLQLYVGIGNIYDNIKLTNRSFIEARAASEYTLLNKNERVIFFSDAAAQEEQTYWHPSDQKAKFIQSLKQGDQEVASETLKNILESMYLKNASIHVLKCMCFDLINTVLKTELDLGLEQNTRSIKTLAEFESIKEFEEQLTARVFQVCQEVERRKESQNHELRERLLKYIYDNYKSPDVGLEQMAAEFQVSMSYLSRLIKEQTGTTFTQLVWQLRVKEARRQLQESDRTVKEIVKDVGYHDVANFIRKFKESEGMTPGQFRKQSTYT